MQEQIEDIKAKILQLAISGKLVKQDSKDESADILYEKIQEEKEKLIKNKKIRRVKVDEIKEEEIPFKIPQSWKWLKLAQVGTVIGGGTPRTKNNEFWDNGTIPWLTPADMKNVTGKFVTNGRRDITELGLEGSSARLVPKGTIIYSSRAPIGYVAIANNELSTNQGFKSLVPFNSVVSEYIYYCLISRTDEIKSRATGTTFKEISGSEFGKTVIPLPPLDEQKRIVTKIDELFSLIDNMIQVKQDSLETIDLLEEKVLGLAIKGKLVQQDSSDEDADILFEKIQEEKEKLIKDKKIRRVNLDEIKEEEIPFEIPDNWKWVKLGDINQLINGDRGKNYPNKNALVDSGIPFINAGHLGRLNLFEGKNYITKEKYNKLSSGKLELNDIIYCLRGSLGKNTINYSMEKGAIASSLVIIRPYIEDLNEKYLYYYLNSVLGKEMIKKYDNGTAQPNLSATNLRVFLTPLPPLNEQKRIVAKLDTTIHYLNEMREKLNKNK